MTPITIAGIPIGDGYPRRTMPLFERFEARYMPEPNSGCWLWMGKVGKSGFPILSVSKCESVYANRFAYERFRGPIPDRVQLRHVCGVKICVNPKHLEPQTEENCRRWALERFKKSYRVDLQSGCWLWTGFLRNGYGGFVYGRKDGGVNTVPAHRLSYELHIGRIPTGMSIDHLCRVPSCVNPQHMEIVTTVENVMRGVSPPAINARKRLCRRGHEFTIENTYWTPDGSRACRQCTNLRATGYRLAKRNANQA